MSSTTSAILPSTSTSDASLPPSTITTAPPTPPPRAPITTHVLSSLTGLPASSVPVSLTLLSFTHPSSLSSTPPLPSFTATTAPTGRIDAWHAPPGPSLAEIIDNLAQHEGGKAVWSLKFEMGPYWEEKGVVGGGFYPEVEVRFWVGGENEEEGKEERRRRHWHVPLVVGPWGYTTYRGS